MFNSIDDYIAQQDPEKQEILWKVYNAIRTALPNAKEKIVWQMPTWWDDYNLMHFSAQKTYILLFPGQQAIEHFATVLLASEYHFSNVAIQFPYSSVPLKLIQEIAEYVNVNATMAEVA